MKANIGLFNESFPPIMDGVAVCVQNYAWWMQQKVGGVSVIVPNKSGGNYKQYPYEVLDYLSVPVPMRHPYVTGIPQTDPVFMAKLLKRRFKIVHAHSPFNAGLMALQVARFQRIPLVATFHSKFRDDFAKVVPSDFLVDQMIKVVTEFFSRADEVWAPQATAADVLREYGFKGPIEVMPNGCDLVREYPDTFFTDARAELGIGPDEFVMLFVGQHVWQKNVELIINGLEQVKDLPYRMYFIGGGVAAEDMKAMVHAKGLDRKVTFTGVLTDRERLTRYYAASDLFLFPSLYDTDGLVVREAAALRTPSVMLREASASGTLTDGETGFLSGGTVESFSACLRALIQDPERVHKVGLKASTSIVRSWEDIVGEVLDRYNSLIARKTQIHPV